MLEFSSDICSYLLNNKSNFAAIHCKAGKGRTGSMICAYLIFSGIANNVKQALSLYAERRSEKLKGVTVPSQIRYLQHFETFLNLTFEKPFYKQIPKIFRMYSIHNNKKNLLFYIFNRVSQLFDYGNSFYIKRIKIGPFFNTLSNNKLSLKVFNFGKKKFFDSCDNKNNFRQECLKEMLALKDKERLTTASYSVFEFFKDDNLEIDSDSEIVVDGNGISFFVWLNFFYITLEKLLDFIVDLIHIERNLSYSNNNKNKLMNAKFGNGNVSGASGITSTSNLNVNKYGNIIKDDSAGISNGDFLVENLISNNTNNRDDNNKNDDDYFNNSSDNNNTNYINPNSNWSSNNNIYLNKINNGINKRTHYQPSQKGIVNNNTNNTNNINLNIINNTVSPHNISNNENPSGNRNNIYSLNKENGQISCKNSNEIELIDINNKNDSVNRDVCLVENIIKEDNNNFNNNININTTLHSVRELNSISIVEAKEIDEASIRNTTNNKDYFLSNNEENNDLNVINKTSADDIEITNKKSTLSIKLGSEYKAKSPSLNDNNNNKDDNIDNIVDSDILKRSLTMNNLNDNNKDHKKLSINTLRESLRKSSRFYNSIIDDNDFEKKSSYSQDTSKKQISQLSNNSNKCFQFNENYNHNNDELKNINNNYNKLTSQSNLNKKLKNFFSKSKNGNSKILNNSNSYSNLISNNKHKSNYFLRKKNEDVSAELVNLEGINEVFNKKNYSNQKYIINSASNYNSKVNNQKNYNDIKEDINNRKRSAYFNNCSNNSNSNSKENNKSHSNSNMKAFNNMKVFNTTNTNKATKTNNTTNISTMKNKYNPKTPINSKSYNIKQNKPKSTKNDLNNNINASDTNTIMNNNNKTNTNKSFSNTKLNRNSSVNYNYYLTSGNNMSSVYTENNKENRRNNCFEFIKQYLLRHTEFLSEYIQLSDLNLIYDKLRIMFPSMFSKEKLFKFTIAKECLDKYSGKDNPHLSVEVTYKLGQSN